MRQLIPEFILEKYGRQEWHGRFPAAALFLDISGFTAITETLMRQGKEGAEILATVMATVFEPLTQSVNAWNGFITNFAGDAFTALFPSVAQALSAACQIQLHAAAGIEHATPHGAFTFAVKIGLGAGQVEWGILEAEDHEQAAYYFKGPAIFDAAQAQAKAQKGELLFSRAALDALPGLPAAPAGEYWRLAGRPPLPLTVAPLLPPPAGDDPVLLGHFLPAGLLETATRGEFRQVAILFVSLAGEPTHEQLAHLLQTIFRLQKQFGGFLNGLDFGDKGCTLLLFWGAPVGYENDVARALNFALDLKAATSLALRAGLTYRLNYAGFVGAAGRASYSCYGRGVILAARLMAAAPWQELWLDAKIARPAGTHFDVLPLGERTLKGFSEPQPIFALRGRKAEKAAGDYQTTLVGREGELAQLRRWIEPIFAGRFAGLVYVLGEPGLGKSRLVYEAGRALGDSVNWFVGQADELIRAPFTPFVYVLKRYFNQSTDESLELCQTNFHSRYDAFLAAVRALPGAAALEAELERVRPVLGALIGIYWPGSLWDQLDTKSRYENTLSALKTFFLAASLLRPTILVLEDGQWLDGDSLALLQSLTRNVTPYPFVILSTLRYRDDGSQPTFNLDGVPEFMLELETLTGKGLRALAAEQLKGDISDDLYALLRNKSAANPFFAQQLLLYLLETGSLEQQSDGTWQMKTALAAMPNTLNAMLIARIDRLARSVQETVKAAAILGQEFEVMVLSAMLQADVLPDVQAATGSQIWTEARELHYIFKHALLRDAAYEMQLRARLRELHALALEALETVYAANLPPHYNTLAYHAEQSQNPARQREYYSKAAAAAEAAYANSLAMDYYRKLLPLLDKPEELMDTHLKLGALLERVGQWQQAETANQEALALALPGGRPADIAHCYKTVGSLARRRGNYQAALDALEQARRLWAALGDSAGLSQAHLEMGAVFWRLGEYANARQHMTLSLQLAEQLNDKPGMASALNHLGTVAWSQGDYPTAWQQYEHSLALRRELGDQAGIAASLNNLGIVMKNQGNYPAARAFHEESLALKREMGDKWGISSSLNNLGIVAKCQGDYPAAQALYEETLFVGQELGDKWTMANGSVNLGLLFHEQGHYAQAQQLSEESLELYRQLNDKWGIVNSLLAVGGSLLPQGKTDAARPLYDEALKLSQEIGDRRRIADTLFGLAQLAAQTGAARRAAWLAAAVEALLTSLGAALEPYQERLYQETIAAARQAQPPEAFAAAWQEGHTLPWETVVNQLLAEVV
ncbi:MAG: tetratricopeptide repeat protein [Chloroflexi bacterium]|nr:tetratricopeptide repeat protein [Chloroflexota bacterium]